MDKIIIIPLIASVWAALYYDPRRLFITMYVPALLLVPVYYETEFLPSTPEFNFSSAVFFPIFVSWLFARRAQGYRPVPLDGAVCAFIFIVFINQWINSDYKAAQKVLFNDVMSRLGPYLMARAVFADARLRTQFLRTIVFVGAGISIVSLYEFRLWTNLFDLPLRRIWPEWVPWDGAMKRWGFKRVAGPFGHPICNGYFFALSTPLAAYLHRTGKLRGKWAGRALVALHALGVLTSLSRAPMLGLFLDFALLAYGWSRRKIVWIIASVPIILIALATTIPMAVEYLSVSREHAQDENQRNAAYRRELIDNYLEIVDQRPLAGWGRFSVPWIDNQVSIDNEYLYIALVSGKSALYLYLVSIFAALVAALRACGRSRDSETPAARERRRLFAWVILAGLLAGGLTQATVYAGTQTVQMFFVFLAMSAGIRQADFSDALAASPVREIRSETQMVGIGGSRRGYAHCFSRTL